MPTIYIDNQPYTVKEGKNLLEACLSLGFNLPYFCWHPAMHSVGACRQCAVKVFKDENDTRGRIMMSCMTEVKDGMRLSVEDADAVAFRKGVIEWLMVNHPHDCPVCDEGGECHLQDMTVMTGQVYRRYRFTKRTYYNQNLGPFVNHEMNRCIQCYRCVRFYKDFAGGHDFDVFSWHDNVYFGRREDGTLENPFSGNLVEVCPTGVFTDKTLKRHYVRKWDMQTAPSICANCGVGCNTIPGEREGMLRRVQNRFNAEVNGYFLCDRGRFGYEFVNSDRRIRTSLVRGEDGEQHFADHEQTDERLAVALQHDRVIGIGSPRASMEANFALQSLVGKDRFYAGIPDQLHKLQRLMLQVLRQKGVRTAAQQEIAHSDAVFILGEDVANSAPMLALALRQAALQGPREEVQQQYKVPHFEDFATRELIGTSRSPFFVATPNETWLETEATACYRGAPDDLARLGFAVAHAIDSAAPAVSGLTDEIQQLAKAIADGLLAGKRPVILSGFSCGSEAVIQAAANIAIALQQVGHDGAVSFTVPDCNSLGLAMLDGKEISGAVDAVTSGEVEAVIVLENDLYASLNTAIADTLLGAPHVIVLEALENEMTRKAEILLPAATFAEAGGTFVNHEGRAQRFFQVIQPGLSDIRESWRWLGELFQLAGSKPVMPWENLDEVIDALVEAYPELAGVHDAAPRADFRLVGQKIPRQTARVTGRTALKANVTVFEPPPPDDPDSPFAFSMEGYQNKPPAPLVQRFWSPGWNSVQAVNKFQQEVGGPLSGGPAGCRLLDPEKQAKPGYFTEIPRAFMPQQGKWLVLPAYHIFGSEPLSMLSPGVAERAPLPYLAINPAGARQLGVNDGEQAILQMSGHDYPLAVKVMPELPIGVVMVPAGIAQLRGLLLPGWGTLHTGQWGGQP